MTYEQFSEQLKKTSLTKKEFALGTGLSQSSVTNWKAMKKVPSWVESWLKNYIEAKDGENLKKIIKESVCEE